MAKNKKLDAFKNKLYAVLILFFILLISIFGIMKKVSDSRSLIDKNNVVTADIYAVQDYYNQDATIKRAQMAQETISPITSPIDGITDFSLFQRLDKVLETTTKYKEQMKLFSVTNPDYNKMVNDLTTQYTQVLAYSDIFIPHKVAKELLTNTSSIAFDNYKIILTAQFTQLLKEDIYQENLLYHREQFVEGVNLKTKDENLHEFTTYLKDYLIQVNSEIDPILTEFAKEDIYNEVMARSPVIVKQGDLLYKKGDMLTKDQVSELTSMGILGAGNSIYMYIGAAVLFILSVFAALASKAVSGHVMKLQAKTTFIIILLFILVYVPALFVPSQFYMYIPYFVLPIMLTILVSDNIAYIFSLPMTVFYAFIVEADIVYLAILLIGCIASIYLVRKAQARVKMVVAGILLGFINVMVYLSYLLLTTDITKSFPYGNVVALLISSVGAALLSLGLLPVFEAIFNIVTPFKLMELTSPTAPLLKRLMVEAPGTYHHSLMVGNLAEEAAEAIGANGLLARVGSYYHDVGKLNRPSFFSENQSSKTGNPHDTLAPQLSASIIISHATDGVDLAKQAKLPLAIRDMILQHHGTTLVEYFYHKAKREETEQPIFEEDFRYSGPKPRSKEAACVMLADSCEAAVRSLETADTLEIEKIVKSIINKKRDDGQFDRCDLTLKDLDEILFVFMKVFTGFFHQRIKYPSADEKKNLRVKQD